MAVGLVEIDVTCGQNQTRPRARELGDGTVNSRRVRCSSEWIAGCDAERRSRQVNAAAWSATGIVGALQAPGIVTGTVDTRIGAVDRSQPGLAGQPGSEVGQPKLSFYDIGRRCQTLPRRLLHLLHRLRLSGGCLLLEIGFLPPFHARTEG
jgi:hypothetical protein